MTTEPEAHAFLTDLTRLAQDVDDLSGTGDTLDLDTEGETND